MNIKFVVFDFDGVFTDGMFYFDNEKNVKKSYNTKDAYSLKILKSNNIKCGIITNDKVISIEHAPHIFDRLDKVSLGSENPKLNILEEWINEYDFTLEEVAYIGDDLPDIPVLEKVGFSACPADAVEDVKNVSEYICKNKGGKGAAREFVDLIIKSNKSKIEIKDVEEKVNNDGKITAVIPVRKGSTRCPRKNIRNFGDTNLLKLKIETLKKVKGIDRILVSSNCDEMLKIAKELGVDVHKRDEKYCNTKTTGSEVFIELAKNIKTDILLYTHCVAPFTKVYQYEDAINKYLNNPVGSMVSSKILKEFILYKNKSINYDLYNAPPSQYLPDYYTPNFGFVIVKTNTVIQNKNIIVKPIQKYILDYINSIDIDYPCDFIISELLYKHNIINEKIADLIIKKRGDDSIQLLDCTIRDGGYLHNWNYSYEQVKDCYKSVTDSGYDYFEIGFKSNSSIIKNRGKWYYSNENDVDIIKNSIKNGCKIAVLIKPGEINIHDIPKKENSNIDLYRVLINRENKKMDKQFSFYTEKNIEDSCEISKYLISIGYEVSINIGCFDNLTEPEIKLICRYISNVDGLKVIYLADTYGSVNKKNLPIQLHKFYTEFQKYNCNISFGFHCHNNNEDALNKTEMAIFHGCTMIDSCIGGLGRGAGNLKSEQLISHLYKNDINKFINKITPLILYFDKHILSKKEYRNNPYIQSHPYYMISSVISIHPNYIDKILTNNNGIEEDIELILKIYKYTKENNERNYNQHLIKNLLSC
jgi:YrbI family 3-deoxy-D-manno-octulosonate 8-phosphate phosphatase